MGISVSVDSWVQQVIEELSSNEYPIESQLYANLISSASNYSEIFVIDPVVFEKFINSKHLNVNNAIDKCLGSLISSEPQISINAASLLSRILPYLSSTSSFLPFQDFVISERKFLGQSSAPGSFIIKTCLSLLTSFSSSSPSELASCFDSFGPIFDLTLLTISSLSVIHHNNTLFHELMIETEVSAPSILHVLLNYVHLSGRRLSIICLLTLILFHPAFDFNASVQSFIEGGGNLSQNLCVSVGDGSDLICLLCSLYFDTQKGIPSLRVSDDRIIRVALVRLLMNGDPVQLSDIQHSFSATHSILAKALNSKGSSDGTNCHPLENFSFCSPTKSKTFLDWIKVVVPQTYLQEKSCWFTGTDVKIPQPDFSVLDTLVSVNSV